MSDITITIGGDAKELDAATKQAVASMLGLSKTVTAESKKVSESTKNILFGLKSGGLTFKEVGEQAKFSLKQISSEAVETQSVYSKLGDTFKGSFSELAKGVTIGNLVSQGIQAGLGAIRDFVSGSIREFQEEEAAINQLNQALRSTGTFSQGTAADLQAYASEIQRTTKFGDELVLQQLAVAKSLGATTSQSKELVSAAADLSATFGGSLEDNVRKLGITLSGETGRLGQLIPELKGFTKEQLQAGAGIDAVAKKLGGAAANELNTNLGKTQQLANAYGDLQGKFGELIASSGPYTGVVSGLTGWFQRLALSIDDARIAAAREDGTLQENGETLNQLGREYEKLTMEIERLTLRQSQLPGGLDNLDEFKLKKYSQELLVLGQTIDSVSTKIQETQTATVLEGEKRTILDPEQLKADATARAEIIAQNQATEIEFAAFQAEADILKRQEQAALDAADLEQLIAIENEKINARFLAEEAKNAAIQDATNRRLAIEGTALKKSFEQEKAANALTKKNSELAAQEAIKLEGQKQKAVVDILSAGVNLAAAVSRNGGKELFIIQKAVSIAQSIVATATGAAQALALGPPGIPIAATIKTIGAINTATIAATAITGANDGALVTSGIVGKDTEPFLLSRGEIVAPERSFDEVVEGVARQRGFVKAEELQNQGGQEQEPRVLQLVFNGDLIGDEQFVNGLIEKIRDAVQFRNADLGVG